jgi:hypothetical protein
MKRVVVISDLHCGHKVGLTHPDFESSNVVNGSLAHKLSRVRRECWQFYAKALHELQPIDILIVNGDAIDGRGERSGGTELLTIDRNEQSEMAIAAIKEAGAGTTRLTYGTGYHTGDAEDFEFNVAKAFGASIVAHDMVDVNGLVFDIRHHVGGSQSPLSRHNAIVKDRIWGLLWADRGERARAQVIIRSHVHYFVYGGDADWLGIVTPALQPAMTKYGQRRMVGTVDFGLIHFDVVNQEEWTWAPHLLRPRAARMVAEKL